MNHARWFVCLVLPVAASAQSILVVDGLNRPGTNFLDLPAAEAAALDGDVIHLRSDGGAYTGIQTHKALTITADALPATLTLPAGQPFRVAGIAAGKHFTLSNCVLGPANPNGPVLQIVNCTGTVVLSQLVVASGFPSVEITGSAGVLLQESSALDGHPCVSGRNSTLSCQQDQLAGGTGDPRLNLASGPAVDLQQCDTSFTLCDLVGGTGNMGIAPAPAMLLANSTMALGGAAMRFAVRAGQAGTSNGTAAAVTGTNSTLRVDPFVSFEATGNVPATQGVTLVLETFPTLTTRHFNPGPLAHVLHYSGPGLTILLVGLSGTPPIASNLFSGDLWLDPNAISAQLGVPLSVHEDRLPTGATFVAQVLSLSHNGEAQFSNPVAVIGF